MTRQSSPPYPAVANAFQTPLQCLPRPRPSITILFVYHGTNPLLTLAASLVLAACGTTQVRLDTPTAPFLTATLAASLTASPTSTPLPPTAVPTGIPVEGTITTQLNVRAEPSTASQTVGTLAPLSKVQILVKDSGGNWYQVLYAAGSDGKGWVTAKYVQVSQGQEIPALVGTSGVQGGPSGVITQQVNVRSGPGTSFEALGTLNPQDSVTVTGKNPDGTWLQVAFNSGPGGFGWISAGYVMGMDSAMLPIINEQGQLLGTGTPPAAAATYTPTRLPAFDDGDSASHPGASMTFSPSGARSLQFSSDISVPEGDAEDWVAFAPYSSPVSIRLDCLGSTSLVADLLQDGTPLAGMPPLACAEQRMVMLTPGENYLLHVHMGSASGHQYTQFTLKVSTR